MIATDKLERALKRLPGFEALLGCERLSAGASRETYRLTVRMGNGSQVMALRQHDGRSALAWGRGWMSRRNCLRRQQRPVCPRPRVFMMLEPADELGTGIVMEWIDGETLGAKIARAPELEDTRKMLAHQCGEVLARLHKADVKAGGLDGILESFDAEHSVRKTHAAYLEFETPQPMIDFTAKWLLANLPKKRPLTLVHSDFRNGNFIVQPGKGIAAVLDWELAHIGDRCAILAGWSRARGASACRANLWADLARSTIFSPAIRLCRGKGRSYDGAVLGNLRILLVGGWMSLHGCILSRWKRSQC